MTEPVLTQRALNRALLARQLLLERVDLPIPEALTRIAGIQNQYAPNAYLRLWSCLERFRRADLTSAYEDGSVVQGTLMRGTIHTVAAADYHPMLKAVARSQREWANRATGRKGDVDHESHVRRVRAALADGPMRRPDLMRLLEGAPPSIRYAIDTGAEILRLPPSGTWARRRADRCGLADDLIDHVEIDEASALAWLVDRYLASFGPASPGDIGSFMGIGIGQVREIVETLPLRRVAADDGTDLLDVEGAPLPDADVPAPVRFLPTWDAILLVHARRTQVLPEEYRPLVFHTKMPPSYPTVLVDGQVAATWRWEEDHIEVSPFRKLTADERDQVDAEAARLGSFHAPEA
ncbi:MAG TPA: winged helix DNA-binding domain-containing protein [Candidatus Limnocylindria bacterium]|nr:winged helix DNA-binding domain-containing protein [Candidatus Limnocylindria bacterium]